MHLDRLRAGLAVLRPDEGLEALAGQDAVAADAHRGNGDDIVAPRVEPGGLAIERHRLVRRPRLEQELVGVVAERGPVEQPPQRRPASSEGGQVVAVAERLAELPDDPQRVAQDVAVGRRELAGSTSASISARLRRTASNCARSRYSMKTRARESSSARSLR